MSEFCHQINFDLYFIEWIYQSTSRLVQTGKEGGAGGRGRRQGTPATNYGLSPTQPLLHSTEAVDISVKNNISVTVRLHTIAETKLISSLFCQLTIIINRPFFLFFQILQLVYQINNFYNFRYKTKEKKKICDVSEMSQFLTSMYSKHVP